MAIAVVIDHIGGKGFANNTKVWRTMANHLGCFGQCQTHFAHGLANIFAF
jgi:hypothetical protein